MKKAPCFTGPSLLVKMFQKGFKFFKMTSVYSLTSIFCVLCLLEI